MKTFGYRPFILLLIIVNFILLSCNSKKTESIFDEILFSNISYLNSSENDTVRSIDLLNTDSILALPQNNHVIDSTKQYIYLTFDDGPYKGSANINKVIKEEQVKATVFVVGFNAYTSTLRQYIDDYKANDLIEISNHTYSHANRNKFIGYYKQPEVVLEDVKKNENFFNIENKIVRLPGRNVWCLGDQRKYDYDKASKKSANYLAENNYYVLGWDFEWRRLKKKKPLEQPIVIYEEMLRRLDKKETLNKNHLVLLMHDDMFNNEEDAEKLRELIKLIKNNQDLVLEFASNYPIKTPLNIKG